MRADGNQRTFAPNFGGHFSEGRLRNLHPVVKNSGNLTPCTSIFPSLRPAATRPIVTGLYPWVHGIGVVFWFDIENDKIACSGDDLMLAVDCGFHKYFIDFCDSINFKRLR